MKLLKVSLLSVLGPIYDKFS